MTTSNNIFDAAQRDLLRAALNRIVPASGDMPGAGDLGVGAFVEGVVAGRGKLRRAFLDGLVQIELAAQQRGGSFISLSPQAQSETLQAIEVAQSEFFQTLVIQTYRGYYTNETVFDLLKYRAPQPGRLQSHPSGRIPAGAGSPTGANVDSTGELTALPVRLLAVASVGSDIPVARRRWRRRR